MTVERLDARRAAKGGGEGPRDPAETPQGTPPGLPEFSAWLDRQGYARITQDHYLKAVDRCFRWLRHHDRPLPPEATWKDLRAFGEQEVPYTYASRQGVRSALVAFYRCCGVPREETPDWAVLCPKQPEPRYRGLEVEDVHRLLEAARSFGPSEYAMCAALYYQALRREETSKVRWAEVDFHERTVRGVGKGGWEFVIPLHPHFAEALADLDPQGPYVFPGRWPGTHVSPATVWSTLRLIGERAGLGKVTPHQLRHSSIATVHDSTENLRTAMEWARHRNPGMTKRYTRTTDEQLRRGMDAL